MMIRFPLANGQMFYAKMTQESMQVAVRIEEAVEAHELPRPEDLAYMASWMAINEATYGSYPLGFGME
jgi:hypothetical protein